MSAKVNVHSCSVWNSFILSLNNIKKNPKKISAKNPYFVNNTAFLVKKYIEFRSKIDIFVGKNSRIPCYFQTKFSENPKNKSVINRHILKSFSKYSPYPPKNITLFSKNLIFGEKWIFNCGEFEVTLIKNLREKNLFIKVFLQQNERHQWGFKPTRKV